MPEKATPLSLVYGGTSLDGLLYRATADCPPTLDDFRSHESLGLPYPQGLFIRATGISVYRTRRQLERSRVRFDLGPATAAVELRTAGVAWAEPEAWRQGSRRPARQASAWRATPPTRARQYARHQAEAWRRSLASGRTTPTRSRSFSTTGRMSRPGTHCYRRPAEAMTTADEFADVLLDRWSSNFLGEWHTLRGGREDVSGVHPL